MFKLTKFLRSNPSTSSKKVQTANELLAEQVMSGKIKSLTWSDVLKLATDHKNRNDGELFERLRRQILVKSKLSKITTPEDKKALEVLKNRDKIIPTARGDIAIILKRIKQ